MSVNVIDVEESDVEGFFAPTSAIIVVAVTASLGLESVDLGAVVADDYGGVGGD